MESWGKFDWRGGWKGDRGKTRGLLPTILTILCIAMLKPPAQVHQAHSYRQPMSKDAHTMSNQGISNWGAGKGY